MKKVIIIIITVIFMGTMLLLVATNSNNGIVTLEGYSEGVAFCESKYSVVVHLDEAHIWNDGIATYVINKGHYSDPQVKELVNLTHKECAKLAD